MPMHHTRRRVLGLAAPFALLVAGAASAAAAPSLKGRAVWAHPRDAGTTEASVIAFVDQLSRANVNTVVMEVKTAGGIYWPSERFAETVVAEYRTFDFPAVLIRESHKRGIAVHAWFFDFAEGADSYVARQHPEWLARNPEGQPTTSEMLRGQPYRLAWMCPARRPGYTDQWLVPLIVEFATRYEVDAIHHDYVRYPGDLAPDTYCFCDDCLRELPKYASYYSPSRPDDPLASPFDRPHLEAHWERSPRVMPPNWDQYSREMKSRLLLDGSSFPGGHHDLDYFFYEYRVHWIAEFARLAFDEARRARPGVEMSAAVFKNPVQSGRFIGQDWRRFAGFVQYLMPMDYRGHYAGDFETHLGLLAESIQQQKGWARDFPHLWIGIAATQLYDEERMPLVRVRALVASGGATDEVRAQFDLVSERLKTFAPDLRASTAAYVNAPSNAEELVKKIDTFLANPPAGYFPPEKLTRTLDTVKQQGVEGIVIFSSSGLTTFRLWEAAGGFFAR